MVGSLKKFVLLYRASIVSQLSYKKNLIVELVVWFLYALLPLFAMDLFLRDHVVGASMLVYYMYGMILVAYNLARMFARGLDQYEQLLFTGALDVYFTRPMSVVVQVIGSELFLRRLSGIVVGVIAICKSYAMGLLVSWWFSLYLVVVLMVVFVGLMLVSASILTVTQEGTMLASILVDSSAHIGFYPTTMVAQPARFVFMYVVPIYFCLYVPVEMVLSGKYVLGFLIPFGVMCIVFGVGLFVFHLMLKQYQSSNG